MYQLSPEFTEIGPEAIDCCIENGAAKIAGAVSYDSLSGFLDSQTLDPDGIRQEIPELDAVWGFLWQRDHGGYFGTQTMRIDIKGCDEVDAVDVHADKSASTGITAIVPYVGDRALFAANNKPFLFRPDLDNPFDDADMPAYIAEYGIGDIMLVRQPLRRVNGQPVSLYHAWHAGLSRKRRDILCIDFLNDSLDY